MVRISGGLHDKRARYFMDLSATTSSPADILLGRPRGALNGDPHRHWQSEPITFNCALVHADHQAVSLEYVH
jgi:hypothetical protein